MSTWDQRFVDPVTNRVDDTKTGPPGGSPAKPPPPDYDFAKTDVWLRDENGKSFLDYCRCVSDQLVNQMDGVNDLHNLGFLQGQRRVLKWLLRLREES